MHRPLATRQLIAIAWAVIVRDVTMSDSTWREGIKCLLVAQGWAYPPPHAISQAMSQVEVALERRWGRRPI